LDAAGRFLNFCRFLQTGGSGKTFIENLHLFFYGGC